MTSRLVLLYPFIIWLRSVTNRRHLLQYSLCRSFFSSPISSCAKVKVGCGCHFGLS